MHGCYVRLDLLFFSGCFVLLVSGPYEFAVTIRSIQFNYGISQPIIFCSRPVGQDLFTILGNTSMYSLLVDVRFHSGWKMVHVPTHVATYTMVESAKTSPNEQIRKDLLHQKTCCL